MQDLPDSLLDSAPSGKKDRFAFGFILPTLPNGEDKSSPFINCIRKNYRHIRKWAKRTQTNCFRIYDRHLHHYPLAIDFYNGRFCLHYFSKNRDPSPPPELVQEVENVLFSLFGTNPEAIYWRVRIKRSRVQQYEKANASCQFFTVMEHGVHFWVNLADYLDTGLFLDHRETRQLAASLASGKKILNLFAYTCSFSVHAAMAGAVSTKSIDLSNTYTDWGRNNFLLNQLSLANHQILRADCLKFLDEEIRSGEKYYLIILDPPTLSRSKKMERIFDIQADHAELISKALCLLSDGGLILFSTNLRTFSFDPLFFASCRAIEVSHKTLPIDFHDPKIHRCWKISPL